MSLTRSASSVLFCLLGVNHSHMYASFGRRSKWIVERFCRPDPAVAEVAAGEERGEDGDVAGEVVWD
jgi:hypothetical protein